MSIENREALGEDEDERVAVTLADDDDGDEGEVKAKRPAKPAADDDDDGDERLSSDQRDDDEEDRPGETEEQKRERRRAERKEKNEKKKMYRLRDEAVIQSLTQETQSLRQMLAEIQQRTTQRDVSDVEAAQAHWTNEAKRAAQFKQQAIQDGDGQKFAQAENYEREAMRRAQHFAELRRRPAAPPPSAPSIDPIVADHAKTFMQRFDWYDPNGSDDLSKTVQALDNGVARDGYDPRTPAYWEELESRMKRRVPAHLIDGAEPKPAARRGPPVGGRSDAPPTGRSVTIPREFREALQEAGIWDDAKRRDRAIKEYLRQSKER
jgi:hypothetical protein